ncbi:hypothetical protein V8C86DRAFT_2546687 [Haematococcus lacustris]
MAPSNILDAIRRSCQDVCKAHSDHVRIDSEALSAYAAQLDPAAVKACLRPPLFPVKFNDKLSEVTFLALFHLLHFGSGYDSLLLERNKRDACESVQFGALGMHLSAKRLDAKWMQQFNNYSVYNFCGIEANEEAPVANLPFVTMSRPGPLAPLVASLVNVVQDTGRSLEEGEGDDSLGALIMRVVTQLAKDKHPAPAAALVAELSDTLQAFQDHGLYAGQRVTFARKAQALVSDLGSRWGVEDPRFAFSDLDQLTADTGPSIPAALRALGLLHLAPDLAAAIDKGEDLPPGPHERALRAAAVTAVDALAAALQHAVSARELSSYLNLLTEQGQELHGRAKRHLTKGTIAY